jgi:apolipoprotein N-acyltransferase
VAQTDLIITEADPKPQPPAAVPTPSRRAPGLRLAVLAGLLLWLASPPVTAWPLAWVAVAPLIVSVTRAKHFRQALWRGYVFGWVYLGAVWYWTGLTIVAWTRSAIGWLAWFGLTLLLAGYYAAWGGVTWLLTRARHGGQGMRDEETDSSRLPHASSLPLAAPAAAWAVMEWTRTLGPITMPWAQLSYTQYRFLPVLQIAELTGAYGVSFVMMLVNGAAAVWWMRRGQPDRTRGLWASLTLTGMVCLYGLARLVQPEAGTPLKAAAIQSNADPFKEEATTRTLQTFADLTEQTAASVHPPPALYVWPESAAPGDALHTVLTQDAFKTLVRDYHAALCVGSRIIDPKTGAESNSTLLFPPDGGPPLRYDKVQLVPFGEFIPFRPYWPTVLSATFGFFATDVAPGESGNVLRFAPGEGGRKAGSDDSLHPAPYTLHPRVAVGPFICYESMYPQYAREMTRAGANLLVTQSNDAWFQSRAAMEQHLAAVVLRAIENRRDVVRSTTTGITCLVDAKGGVFARAPLRTPCAVVGSVQLLQEKTFYTRFGDWFVGLCGGSILFVASGTKWHQWKREVRIEKHR